MSVRWGPLPTMPHGLRPPAHAQRIFSGRWHVAHRRCGRRRACRWPGGAGADRPEQPVRRGAVLPGLPRPGRQADPRRRPVDGARRRRQAAQPAAAAGAGQAGLPEPVRAADARLDAQCAAHADVDPMGLAGRVERRADRAVRGRHGQRRHGAAGRRCGARRGAGPAPGALLRGPLLPGTAARRPAQPRDPRAPRGGTGRAAEAAGGGHAPGAVSRGRGLRGP